MEKRIELEKRGRRPEKVTELNLDNARSTSIVGLSSEFVHLRTLSLNSVGLTSLKGFPKLPKLERLELSDNRISGGLNAILGSPQITYLTLSNNRIQDLKTVEPLAELKGLRVLDLFNCGVTSVEGYREKMFAMLPSLKYLDGYDKDENEASSDEGCEEDDDDDEADEEEEVGDEDEEDEPEGADEEDEEEDVGLEYLEKEDIDEDDEADYEPGEKGGSSAAAAADDDDDDEGSTDQPAKKKKKSE